MSNSVSAPVFTVVQQSFEGPLDVLLDVIERKKLPITDISLAEVADEFIAHVAQVDAISIEQRVDFMVVLATLMLIKSRALLPSITLSEEEELAVDDLERRLKVYAEIKKGSAALKNAWMQAPLCGMQKAPARDIAFAPSSDLTVSQLSETLQVVVRALPTPIVRNATKVEAVVSIEQMMERIAKRIETAARTSFNHMTNRGSKSETIVSFLALLELVRHGKLAVAQTTRFGDIDITA